MRSWKMILQAMEKSWKIFRENPVPGYRLNQVSPVVVVVVRLLVLVNVVALCCCWTLTVIFQLTYILVKVNLNHTAFV